MMRGVSSINGSWKSKEVEHSQQDEWHADTARFQELTFKRLTVQW